jgi:transcriptional regulator with XRE-family HTH domain
MNDILNILMDAGARLRSERLAKSLKQEDFADIGGVKRVSQSAYENGKSAPGIDYLFRLQSIGVDIGYIVTGFRFDGSLGLIEQTLVDYFRSIDPDQRDTLLTVAAALAAFKMPDAHSYGQAQHQSQTLHTPKHDYKGQPPRA